MPHNDEGVGWQAARKYLSLSGKGWRNLGQELSTRLSMITGSTAFPLPGMRRTAPSASLRPRAGSSTTSSPMRGTPWCPVTIAATAVGWSGTGRAYMTEVGQ